MINNDIAIDRLKDLILTSVNLTEWQKEQIREVIKLLGGNRDEQPAQKNSTAKSAIYPSKTAEDNYSL